MSDKRYSIYAVLLLFAGLLFQLIYPIKLIDADMWYHMSAGKKVLSDFSVANSAFFSFIEPEKKFINYYWGFQVLAAAIYEWFGYNGLIIIRSLLFSLSALFVWLYVRPASENQKTATLLLVLFVCFFVFINDRAINFRPHLFSHFFILVSIYILDRNPKFSPLLPLLTILWVNLHGIEYVVPLLIGGSYFIESLIDRKSIIDKKTQISLLACLPALLINPEGWKILTTPFTVASHTNLYILEMLPLSADSFHTFSFSPTNIKFHNLFPILFFASIFAFFYNLLKKKLRLSHALMMLGGTYLLLQSNRFIWEWVFLILPLLNQFVRLIPFFNKKLTPAATILLIGFLTLPLANLAKRLPNTHEYPFQVRNSPQKLANFLNQQGSGGNLLASPINAGYLHWALNDDYKIFADLQMSLFDDFDIYRLIQTFSSPEVFRNITEQYPIDFVLISQQNKSFASSEDIKDSFSPIFIDHRGVLFANNELQKSLISQHKIDVINPFEPHKLLIEGDNDDSNEEHIDKAALELKQLNAASPKNRQILDALTRLHFNNQKYEEAQYWGHQYITHYPSNPNSHYLMGLINEHINQCGIALENFFASEEFSDAEFKRTIYRHIGACSYELKDFAMAYEYFWRGINPIRENALPEHIYKLAFSAYVEGHTEEAILLLRILLINIGDKNESVKTQGEALFEKLRDAEDNLPSFTSWLLSYFSS